MTQSNEVLLQGNRLIQNDLKDIDIPAGTVIILHSGFGVEGVFTDAERLKFKISQLRGFMAYHNEPLSISRHELDPVV